MTDVTVSLGANKYGKAENRVVRIYRDTPRHEIVDLNVTSQLRGQAFSDSFLTGDNSLIVATDTQKNTAFAFAKEVGIPSPEEYLLALGEHFVSEFDWVEGGLWQAEQYEWERITAGGRRTTTPSSGAGKPPVSPRCRRPTAPPTSSAASAI